MVLGEQIDRKVMLVEFDIGRVLELGQQRTLDLPAGDVLVVQNAILRMPALAAEVVRFLALLLIETRAPFDDLSNPFGPFFYDDPHNLFVAEAVAGVEGIFDVLLEGVVLLVPHRRHAPLRVGGVGFLLGGLGEHGDLQLGPGLGQLDGGGEAGNAGADDEYVCLRHGLREIGLLVYWFIGLLGDWGSSFSPRHNFEKTTLNCTRSQYSNPKSHISNPTICFANRRQHPLFIARPIGRDRLVHPRGNPTAGEEVSRLAL